MVVFSSGSQRILEFKSVKYSVFYLVQLFNVLKEKIDFQRSSMNSPRPVASEQKTEIKRTHRARNASSKEDL